MSKLSAASLENVEAHQHLPNNYSELVKDNENNASEIKDYSPSLVVKF